MNRSTLSRWATTVPQTPVHHHHLHHHHHHNHLLLLTTWIIQRRRSTPPDCLSFSPWCILLTCAFTWCVCSLLFILIFRVDHLTSIGKLARFDQSVCERDMWTVGLYVIYIMIITNDSTVYFYFLIGREGFSYQELGWFLFYLINLLPCINYNIYNIISPF